MYLNKQLYYQLPKIVDDEFNPIEIILRKPDFVTFDKATNIFKFSPTIPAQHLGFFMIKGEISDSRLSTAFAFSVSVSNKAPYFITKPFD
jgi:hypothetical protein